MASRQLKRAFDVVISATTILVLSPLWIVTLILVRFKHGSPVLFRQRRPGLHGEPFMLLKFRTMTNDRNSDGALLPDAQRLTRLGRFLRATTIDELPELFNVLRGDMSLVGPRPLLMAYLTRYTPTQARRHEVRPGLTGWAVVNGRNAIGWEEKFKLDVWYVDNHSFWLDVKIIWRTILLIFRRVGVSAQGHATMPEFVSQAHPIRSHEAGHSPLVPSESASHDSTEKIR